MGATSQDQIDEAIAWNLANRSSEDRIVKRLATLERMTDVELAAIGVLPPPPKPDLSLSQVMKPSDFTLDGTLAGPRRVMLRSSCTASGTPAKSLP